MKKIITAFVFCFLCGECFSQAGEWVWIKGDSTANTTGNYGVQGVPSPSNNPPGLYEPCEWTDLNGNLWLFGGLADGALRYGDLWKYNPISNEWTWMKGSGTPNNFGNYGIQGVPAISNSPPSRAWGISTWTDNQNNLWMFGGALGGSFNDLWKYNILTNEWTWMKGSNIQGNPGNYGTQGISDSANNPPCRTECAAAWTDNSGDLWLFGGYGVGFFNDLWRYNISLNQWTWMKGSQNPNQPGNYGTLGIENITNTPGARMTYSHWKDSVGNLWLFAGTNNINFFSFNDLWRYNPITNNWAWIGGSNTVGALGMHGTNCNTSLTNNPGERAENRAVWTDPSHNFWFFGGAKELTFYDKWNDLWKYCVLINKWIWISGDSISNSIGRWNLLGVSSPNNIPNARAGSVGWTDNIGDLYLFGGIGNLVCHSDLWKYTIDTSCGVCPASTGIQENNFTNDLLFFPNPTNSSLTISFSSSSNQTIELRIYNTLGKQIYFTKEEITKGKFEKEINVEKWSDGIYFLQVKTKEGNMNRKVIINH